MERVRTPVSHSAPPPALDRAPLSGPMLHIDLTIDEESLPQALATGSTGTGVFIPIARRIPIGRTVDLRVQDREKRLLARIKGEVSWVRAAGAHATFPAGIGIKVVTLAFESPRWIARLCSDLHAESRDFSSKDVAVMVLSMECPRCHIAMEMHEHLTLLKCAGCGAMLSSDD